MPKLGVVMVTKIAYHECNHVHVRVNKIYDHPFLGCVVVNLVLFENK